MKNSIHLVAALGAVLAVGACNSEKKDSKPINPEAASIKVDPPKSGNWTEVVNPTPQGGFLMGNPDAKVKLIEYASITCPHCAEFSEAATEPLSTNYVKGGQVSWEYRPYLLFPTDPGIFSLLKCQGAKTFFPLTEQLYANQRDWGTKVQSLSPAQQQQIQSLPPQQATAALIKATGVDTFLRMRGMPQSKIDSCLADQNIVPQLLATTQLGQEEGVTGTPNFFINGEKLDAGTWAALEPEIKKALQ